ncbi:LysR substrate-binding domain-containing protein [Pseudomonas oryzihabitans]|uniref:LysR substrate-binding domain-containing protein n=1 Tax=Pseudomonas oryzihabitans TaxID=47885 RepID=UPI0034607610
MNVSLFSSDRLPVLGAGVDVALTIGNGRFKHGEAWPLFREEVFPVYRPRLLADQALPVTRDQLARWPLLHVAGMTGLPHWRGHDGPPPSNSQGSATLRVDNCTLVIPGGA